MSIHRSSARHSSAFCRSSEVVVVVVAYKRAVILVDESNSACVLVDCKLIMSLRDREALLDARHRNASHYKYEVKALRVWKLSDSVYFWTLIPNHPV